MQLTSFSELPLIVSLEVHASLEQQEKMVQIIKDYWGGMLVTSMPLHMDGLNMALPVPKDLKKKILIKVKQPLPEQTMERRVDKVDLSDNSQPGVTSSSSSSEISPTRKLKSNASTPRGKKVADVLSELGIYTKGYSFRGFDQPGLFLKTTAFYNLSLIGNVCRG